MHNKKNPLHMIISGATCCFVMMTDFVLLIYTYFSLIFIFLHTTYYPIS